MWKLLQIFLIKNALFLLKLHLLLLLFLLFYGKKHLIFSFIFVAWDSMPFFRPNENNASTFLYFNSLMLLKTNMKNKTHGQVRVWWCISNVQNLVKLKTKYVSSEIDYFTTTKPLSSSTKSTSRCLYSALEIQPCVRSLQSLWSLLINWLTMNCCKLCQ